MNLKKISFVILLGVTLSIFLPNYSSAQETEYESYRPPDAFATSAGPSPTATPTTQSCNGHCNCNCTDERCNYMYWEYQGDSTLTVEQCQQNCVTAANQYCESMNLSTTTSSTEPTPYATPLSTTTSSTEPAPYATP